MKNQKFENSYHYLSMFQRTNFFLSKYTSKVELYVSFHKSGTSNPFQTYFFELQTELESTETEREGQVGKNKVLFTGEKKES